MACPPCSHHHSSCLFFGGFEFTSVAQMELCLLTCLVSEQEGGKQHDFFKRVINTDDQGTPSLSSGARPPVTSTPISSDVAVWEETDARTLPGCSNAAQRPPLTCFTSGHWCTWLSLSSLQGVVLTLTRSCLT